jgi:biotin carboxyl carrier protein
MRRLVLIHRGERGPEEVAITRDGDSCVLSRAGVDEHAEITELPDGRLLLRLEEGRQICGRASADRAGWVRVTRGGMAWEIGLAEPLRDRIAHAAARGSTPNADEEIRTLMPGRVVEIAVSAGDRVAAGDLLLVLEAMKMQNEIRTASGGRVLRVEVEPGRPVEAGTLLVVVKSEV